MRRDSEHPGEIPGNITYDDICSFAEAHELTEPNVVQPSSEDYWSIRCEGKNPHIEITIKPETPSQSDGLISNFFIRSEPYKISTYDQLLSIDRETSEYPSMHVTIATTDISWQRMASQRNMNIGELPNEELFKKVKDKVTTIGCRIHVATTTKQVTGDKINSYIDHLDSIQNKYTALLIQDKNIKQKL